MKYFFITYMFFLFSLALNSQTFSTHLENPFISNGSGSGFSVFLKQDTLMVIGNIAVQPTGGIGNSFLHKFSLDGELLEENYWDPELESNSSSAGLWGGADFIQTLDSSFISVAYNEFDNQNEDSTIPNQMIQILDQFGHEISRANISYTTDDINIKGVVSKNEDEHLLYGSAWNMPGIGPLGNNGYLHNCNSLGETNWVQYYDSVADIRFIDLFPDGSSILGGWVAWGNGGAGIPFNTSDQIIIRTDELGNEQWRYIFGATGSESYSPVHVTDSGDIIVAAKRNNYSSTNQGALWVQRVQDNGTSYEVVDEILMDEFNMYNDYIPYGIKEVSDGGFVGYGFGELPYNEETLESAERGLVFKVDQNLDSLWARHYGVYLDEIDAENYFYDMVEGPDSCLYLTGTAERGQGSNLNGLGHIWLVKLDSYGCLEPGCHLLQEDTTVVDTTNHITQIIGLQSSIKAFPNPVNEALQLEFTIPYQFTIPEHSELRVIDQVGRVVKSIPLDKFPHEHQLSIDFSDITSGVYTVHWLSPGKWLDSVRVVKN